MSTRILLVCMGNICRSPMAEGLVRHKARERGMDVRTDSAGTIDSHVGETPDRRAQKCMDDHGIDISDLRARQIRPSDFHEFDLLLAMDLDNLKGLRRIAPNDALLDKARLMMDFAPDLPQEVPDPYFGGQDGFEEVYRMLDAACEDLLDRLQQNGG